MLGILIDYIKERINRKMNRRNFLTALGIGSIASTIAANASAHRVFSEISTDPLFTGNTLETAGTIERILPNGLKKGSVVAITAPASPTSPGEIAATVSLLRSNGFKVVVGDTITKHTTNFRYLSGSDEERANEFMDFIQRKDVDCILCARGGYGVMRILNLIDFDIIKQNPKIIIGFSDITALLNSIFNLTGLVAFHGPVAATTFDKFTFDNFKKVLFMEQQFTPIEVIEPNTNIITAGSGSGKIVGGNLKMLVSTLGTPYEVDTTDSVLFIEEVSEHAYQIDRMLTQLLLSNKLQKANAIVFGQFKELNKRSSFFPTKSYTIKEVLDQLITPLKIPSIVGMPFGHIQRKMTLPIGINAILDTKLSKLTITEKSVS